MTWRTCIAENSCTGRAGDVARVRFEMNVECWPFPPIGLGRPVGGAARVGFVLAIRRSAEMRPTEGAQTSVNSHRSHTWGENSFLRMDSVDFMVSSVQQACRFARSNSSSFQ